ncbi:uncharacterized protein LOC134232162 [Saccostrea cucullata]|uniref:uncharacterized protein LOC134232162 n=1 Tax=Saccostrea cuccullata TaxID=36930 RepID=UPI002ECFE663
MGSNDYKKFKVARCSGSTEKQTIQFDSEDKPLYSAHIIEYVSENRNMDICVADWEAKAVVVVNQTGILRFRYTGHPSFFYGWIISSNRITTRVRSSFLTRTISVSTS